MTGEQEGEKKLLVFRLGRSECCIPLRWIWGVVGEEGIGAEEKGKGGIGYRGDVLPVVDLRDWLGVEKVPGEKGCLLIVGEREPRVAAAVDATVEFLVSGAVQRWPSLLQPLLEGVFLGVTGKGERLILAVDPAGLMHWAGTEGEAAAKEAERNDKDSFGG